jgi:CubicO group peptidase (beta-lactamase class C family)
VNNPAASGANLANWRQAPWNCWAFHHVSQLIPVARIARDPARTAPLPAKAGGLDGFSFHGPDGTRWDLPRFLAASSTDGLLVLRDGAVAFEWYGNGFTADAKHIIFSVSKSITGTVAGALVAQGKLDPDAPVTRYVPEAAGSVYGDCTVRHVLDMTVGLAFVEDYLDATGDFARYRLATGWNPSSEPGNVADLHRFLLTLRRDENPHGAKYHYASPNSDMLGWIVERAAGKPYASMVSELLWQPMGAEQDAEVTTDGVGAARAAGGVCVSLRDLARFGELMRNGGKAAGRQVIPAAWIDDIRNNGDPAPWAASDAIKFLPHGRYRSQWYIIGNAHDAYCGIGIHGQWVYIDPKAKVVIAKQSSQPLPIEEATDRLVLTAFDAIGHHFA